MTTTTSMTRTIRVAIGAAAVLAMMSQAAQARPNGVNQRTGLPVGVQTSRLVQKGTYMPVLPASPDAKVVRALGHASLNVPAGPARFGPAARLAAQTRTVTGKTSVDWFAAAIGAGFAFAIVLIVIGAAALIEHGRRRHPLSA